MKRLLFVIVLFFGVLSSQAQERTFWQKVHLFLTKPAVVDTTCIYQSEPGLSLGVFSTGQKAGFHVDVNFAIKTDESNSIAGVSSYSLSENICKKVGLDFGYGNVGFSYSLEVGHRSATKKRSLGFSIVGKSWGVHINYFKITNPFTSGLTFGKEGDEDYYHDEFVSKELAALRNLSIDGYYVFNNKRFAFPAAYKVGLVQRHTAGSWMLTARYMQGDLYNSPEASMDSYNLLDCFATLQASVGGGYSVNFVLWHKDPVGLRDKGLRNLTFNLTAMPVLTACNYLKTTSYDTDDEGNDKPIVSKIWCNPMPNFIGSAAVGLSMGRFFFSAQFTYNWFYFRSSDAFNAKELEIPDYLSDLSFHGSFHDWTLKGLLVYRF